MALGIRETFRYEYCQGCGSLQIAEIPADLGKYYPASRYYAYQGDSRGLEAAARRIARTLWWGTALLAPEPLFAVVCAIPQFGSRMRTNRLRGLRGQRIPSTARIADVGGATGQILGILRSLGFRHLTSVDPFSPVSGVHHGIRFIKSELGDVDEPFDLIMYHHSLEHVPDLERELRAANERLNPDGRLLVRMPLLPNEGFDTYGPNWVEIDAPRHLHIPSRSALRMITARCGLKVVASGSDTQEFEFWASEAYALGITLPEASAVRRGLRRYLSRDMRAQRRRADRLNAEDRGGRGWFLFRRSS